MCRAEGETHHVRQLVRLATLDTPYEMLRHCRAPWCHAHAAWACTLDARPHCMPTKRWHGTLRSA
ncbi:MAG TPA: hypothetical protein VIK18_06625, partial [Pirellulales bacterium]